MRICPNCKTQIDNDRAKFCKKCGHRLGDVPSPTPRVDAEKAKASPKQEKYQGIPLSISDSLRQQRNEDSAKGQQNQWRRDKSLRPEEVAPPRPPMKKPASKPVTPQKRLKPQEDHVIAMGMFEAVKSCFSKYCTFKGKASRSEYWYFWLFNMLMYAIPVSAAFIIDNGVISPILVIIALLYNVSAIIPSISVTVRRLHDTGKSGTFIFISLIPVAGTLILLYYLCKKGTCGVWHVTIIK